MGLPEMSFPTAKVSLSLDFCHWGVSRTLRRRTSADLTLGISMPTLRVPGMGASIRILSAARLRANSLSRPTILLRLTPD